MRPSPSLGVEQADAFNLRGHILQAAGSSDAAREYRRSLELFQDLEKGGADRLPSFHFRFGDLLANLGGFARTHLNNNDAQRLLDDGVSYYADLGVRSSRERPATAKGMLDTLRQAVSGFPPVRRDRLEQPIDALEQTVAPAPSRR